eukprot:8795754-Ditylum_brightwellii.AAC.1
MYNQQESRLISRPFTFSFLLDLPMVLVSLRIQSFHGGADNPGLAITVPSLTCRQDGSGLKLVEKCLSLLLLTTEGCSNLLVDDCVQ